METMSQLAPPLSLLDLAPELVHSVLANLSAADLVSFGRTCKTALDYLAPSNQSLWKSCFARTFDRPRNPLDSYDWFLETRRRYRALAAVANAKEGAAKQDADYEEHVATLLDMIATSTRLSPQDRGADSLNLAHIQAAFRSSRDAERFIHDYVPDKDISIYNDLLTHSTNPFRPMTRSQTTSCPPSMNASKLHVLYGLTVRERASRNAHGAARSLTYSWSFVSRKTDFGPFESDGSGEVNWRYLEAIHSIIMRNFEKVAHNRIRVPHGLHHNLPLSLDLAKTRDWAGIEQIWFGSYSYLDYSALFYFNNMADRSAINLCDVSEAHGGMGRARLQIDDSIAEDPRLQTALPLSDKLPRLYFSGESVTEDFVNMPIELRGFAALMPGGQVRWRFIVSYEGNDQWQLEGVQPGGPQTGGVYGTWTGFTHEENGPVGPFCYFPENLCEVVNR